MTPRYDKPDCFAYVYNDFTKQTDCRALITQLCKKRDCPFYRTEKELTERINKYGGRMWWKGDGKD